MLQQVGADNIEVVIAADGDDGRNVIAALQAKQLGFKKVIAIVQEPEYMHLLEKNNVVAISAPWATATMVENLLDRPGLAQLFEFGIGAASLLDVNVPEKAEVAGRPISDIDINIECVIAAIIRNDKFIVPRGGTVIKVDDRVIFIGPADIISQTAATFRITK